MKTSKILFSVMLTFLLYSCSEDNIYITPEDTEGRVNVYIEGDITNEEAAAQLKAEVGTLTQNIYVQNTTNLTDLIINTVNDVSSLKITLNYNLKNITINGKDENFIRTLEIFYNYKIKNTTINKIKKINTFYYASNFSDPTPQYDPIVILSNDVQNIAEQLTVNTVYGVPMNLSFPKLKTIGMEINQNNIFALSGQFLSINLPLLEESISLDISYTDIETLSLPSLKKIKYNLQSVYSSVIKNINLPKLEYCNEFHIWDNAANYPNGSNPNINIPMLNYCKFFKLGLTNSDVSKINGYLHQFLTIQPSSGKILDFEGENQPTGQGLIDKQTLIDQGNTVIFF